MLLQHGDSQFPSGAFAFSAGLEGLFDDRVVAAQGLQSIITSMLRSRWAPFDRVAVRRSWRVANERAALRSIDSELEAMLLAPVDREGSRRAGAALLTTHLRLNTPGAVRLREDVNDGLVHGHRCMLEGSLWRGLGLDETQAALLSGFGFVNALGTAAVRMGHLGALAQQRLVASLLPEIASFAEQSLGPEPKLSAFNPLAEIAMMRHPGRHQNLFAN